ncbi:hypothetical protein B0H13DRAFT_964873 [Mycena leptocephala]|nr:hypothetical protein B0H13DRAFT_964873 [Mycena leptocephala]
MTDDLTEYFPITEKVPARTAREGIILSANAHPDSTASENPAPSLPSRFNTSTEGSALLLPSRFSSSTHGSAQFPTSYDEDAEFPIFYGEDAEFPTSCDEDAEDEDEEEDEDEDGMLNAPNGEDDETNMGEKPQGPKWIKGALVGVGSFGKVYLGMDTSTGLLIAVKQVELPTRSAPDQEFEKLKLSALEREIEL